MHTHTVIMQLTVPGIDCDPYLNQSPSREQVAEPWNKFNSVKKTQQLSATHQRYKQDIDHNLNLLLI